LKVVFWKSSNLAIALQILLTVPMSVVTAEVSFSKVKIIKNFLRNTMTQTRSCDLAMISIKKELANSFNYVISLNYITIEDVIRIFQKLLKLENIIVCCIKKKRQIYYYKRKYEIIVFIFLCYANW
ncbi:hypothetical protein ALC57_06123, partial [Trachymyrmex cornetzi]